MKINFLLTVLLAGFSVDATALEPLSPPGAYASGPASPFDSTKLFSSERAAFALLEGALQQAETVIAATSCSDSVGTSAIEIFTDGTANNPNFNFVAVDSPGSEFILSATLRPYYKFRGQNITIRQTEYGEFNGVVLDNYSAALSYNANGTVMMVMNNSGDVFNINGGFDNYQGRLINDYYRTTDSSNGLPYIMGWGEHTLSKLNYPTQEYWQRSKALRDDSLVWGRTVIVKDRLIGPNACRIVIDLSGDNNPDYFWQSGTLTISASIPSAPVYEFDF